MKGKDSQAPSSSMRKAGLMKRTDVKSVLSLPNTGQAGRQTTAHRRIENYQGLAISWSPLISQIPGTNYCGIISSPQRHDELQALWAQRVSDQQATSWSTRLTQPKAAGAPRWNAAWRRPTNKQHSKAIVSVLSTQHRDTLTSQTSLCGPLGGGGMAWCASLLLQTFLARFSAIHDTRRTYNKSCHTPIPVCLWSTKSCSAQGSTCCTAV